MKAFVNNNLKVVKMVDFILDRIKNMWKKEKMLVTCTSFPRMFSKTLFQVVKTLDYVVKSLNTY